ncbi:AtpZ/AtpI family protein [Frankia canadensis]|nr:AtpZ/AtpI family protein [Frankia canadensis]
MSPGGDRPPAKDDRPAPRLARRKGVGREGGRPAVRQPGTRQGEQHPGEAWNIFGTLIAGMAFWGLVGFGLDRLCGFRALFLPIGLGLGIALSMYLVIYRLTRR